MSLLTLASVLKDVNKSQIHSIVKFLKTLEFTAGTSEILDIMLENSRKVKKGEKNDGTEQNLSAHDLALVYSEFIKRSYVKKENGGLKGVSLGDFIKNFGNYTENWGNEAELRAGLDYLNGISNILKKLIEDSGVDKKGVADMLTPMLFSGTPKADENLKLLNDYLELGYDDKNIEAMRTGCKEVFALTDYLFMKEKEKEIVIGNGLGSEFVLSIGKILTNDRSRLYGKAVRGALGILRRVVNLNTILGRDEFKSFVLESYTARSFAATGLEGFNKQISVTLLALDFISKNKNKLKPGTRNELEDGLERDLRDEFKDIMKVLIAKEKGNFDVLEFYEEPSIMEIKLMQERTKERCNLATAASKECDELKNDIDNFFEEFIKEFKEKLNKPEELDGFSDKPIFEILCNIENYIEKFECIKELKKGIEEKAKEKKTPYMMLDVIQGDVTKLVLDRLVVPLQKEILEPHIDAIIGCLPKELTVFGESLKERILKPILDQISIREVSQEAGIQKEMRTDLSQIISKVFDVEKESIDKLVSIIDLKDAIGTYNETINTYEGEIKKKVREKGEIAHKKIIEAISSGTNYLSKPIELDDGWGKVEFRRKSKRRQEVISFEETMKDYEDEVSQLVEAIKKVRTGQSIKAIIEDNKVIVESIIEKAIKKFADNWNKVKVEIWGFDTRTIKFGNKIAPDVAKSILNRFFKGEAETDKTIADIAEIIGKGFQEGDFKSDDGVITGIAKGFSGGSSKSHYTAEAVSHLSSAGIPNREENWFEGFTRKTWESAQLAAEALTTQYDRCKDDLLSSIGKDNIFPVLKTRLAPKLDELMKDLNSKIEMYVDLQKNIGTNIEDKLEKMKDTIKRNIDINIYGMKEKLQEEKYEEMKRLQVISRKTENVIESKKNKLKNMSYGRIFSRYTIQKEIRAYEKGLVDILKKNNEEFETYNTELEAQIRELLMKKVGMVARDTDGNDDKFREKIKELTRCIYEIKNKIDEFDNYKKMNDEKLKKFEEIETRKCGFLYMSDIIVRTMRIFHLPRKFIYNDQEGRTNLEEESKQEKRGMSKGVGGDNFQP